MIDSDKYLLTCMRYVELNPVRAAMVNAPGEYEWSSYKENAYLCSKPTLVPHEVYLALGSSIHARKKAYRELFRSHINEKDVHVIRCSCQTGTPLGGSVFQNKIERLLGIKVGYHQRGRPRIKGL